MKAFAIVLGGGKGMRERDGGGETNQCTNYKLHSVM
jgi:hypothetical protein